MLWRKKGVLVRVYMEVQLCETAIRRTGTIIQTARCESEVQQCMQHFCVRVLAVQCVAHANCAIHDVHDSNIAVRAVRSVTAHNQLCCMHKAAASARECITHNTPNTPRSRSAFWRRPFCVYCCG